MNLFTNLNIMSQNVHKGGIHVQNILDQYSNGYDILLLQEAPFSKNIRHTTSTTSELGDIIAGPPIHTAWQAVHFFDKHPSTQVCTYINRRLLSDLQISTDPRLNTHHNILCFSLSSHTGGTSPSFVNVYNPPKMANSAAKTLIDMLPHFSDLRILAGDFNIKSSEWQPLYPKFHLLAADLLASCGSIDLTLVNDDGTPTWHHKTHPSSVLDLFFCYDPWLQLNRVVFENDKFNRGTSDHSALHFRLGVRVARPGQQYIPKETDEEAAFISEIREALLCAAQHHRHSALNTFDNLGKAVAAAWTKNAKTSKAGSNPMPWWTPECELAKLAYEGEKNAVNLKIYLAATKYARRTFFDNKIRTMTSTKRPWEGMRWVGPRAPPAFPSISDSAGDPIKDPEKLFAHMHRHFSSTTASGTVDWPLLNALPQQDTCPCPPISMAEIIEALGKTSNTSAPGNNHITWRHLKLIINDDKPLKAVAHLFNLVLKEGVWPSQFKDAKSTIIPKPKKPAYDVPKAFHPIVLLNTLGCRESGCAG
jgi:hypothetical protein